MQINLRQIATVKSSFCELTDTPRGVFSTRTSKYSNSIGLSLVELANFDVVAGDIKSGWMHSGSDEVAQVCSDERLIKEENPLVKSYNILRKMQNGKILLITSDFKSEPLIEEFEKNGHLIFFQEIAKDKFVTYVQKQS